jgi:hypothetical protein
MDHSSLLASVEAALPGLFGVVLLVVLVVLALVVLTVVANWRIYQKAGKPGWASIVPFYNSVIMLEFTNRPLWWVILLFVPVVNIVVGILMMRRLAGVFGKGIGFTVGLVLLPFIFLPILGFGKSQYANMYPSPAPLSEAGKWALIALIAYLLMQTAFSVKIDSFLNDLEQEFSEDAGDDYPTDDSSIYTSDALHVYYDDTIIPGAEPETFSDLGRGYGADENSVYYYGEIMGGADAATFIVTDYFEEGYDAEDANAFYYAGRQLSNTEMEEIRARRGETGIDRK